MAVALAKAADILGDACRKNLVRNWELRSLRASSEISPPGSQNSQNSQEQRKKRRDRQQHNWSHASGIFHPLPMVLKHSLVNIPSGLPIPISSNHSTDINIYNKIKMSAKHVLHGSQRSAETNRNSEALKKTCT